MTTRDQSRWVVRGRAGVAGKFRFRNQPVTRIPPGPSQHGCMRVSIAAAAVACLAAGGVSGCTQPTETCAVADYGGGSTTGYQTPQQALQSVLTGHQQWLSATGWKLAGHSAGAATFVSGNDSVDVVKNKAGKWNVGGVTACK